MPVYYLFVSLRFSPQRQKMFMATTKGKRSMKRLVWSKEYHVTPEDWFSFPPGLPCPFSLCWLQGCCRVCFLVSHHALHVCLLIMTCLLLISQNQGSVMSQVQAELFVLWWKGYSCLVTTLPLQVGVLGPDSQSASLLAWVVKKEQQIAERKILTFKDKAVQGWMSFLFTLPLNLNVWLAPAVPQSAGWGFDGQREI